MAENKTKPIEASVDAYLNAIDDETRRKDCKALTKLIAKATKMKPKMWGTSIVGFGILKYKYESGREGETCLIGFSSRKGDISIYGTGSAPAAREIAGQAREAQDGQRLFVYRQISGYRRRGFGTVDR